MTVLEYYKKSNVSVNKIITGGRVGAEISGNIFSTENMIETTINTYNRNGVDKNIEQLSENYIVNIVTGLIGENGLKTSILYNIRNSDATVIFTDYYVSRSKSSGSRLTVNYCEKERMPYHIISIGEYLDYCCGDNIEKLVEWFFEIERFLVKFNVKTLNIAGQRKFRLVEDDRVYLVINTILDNVFYRGVRNG